MRNPVGSGVAVMDRREDTCIHLHVSRSSAQYVEGGALAIGPCARSRGRTCCAVAVAS